MRKIAVFMVVAVVAATSQATLVLHEEFDGYEPGTIIGQTGQGMAETGVWRHDNVGGSVEIGPGLSGDNALVVTDIFGRNKVTIDHTAAGWGTGTMYISYLVNWQSYGGHAYVSGGDAWDGAFGHGWNSEFTINNATGPGDVPYAFDTTYRLVAKTDWDAGETTMWADPASEADTPAVVLGEVQATPGVLRIDLYGTGTYDDIRIGTTFADVIPEPSTLALLGLAGLMVGLRRRK